MSSRSKPVFAWPALVAAGFVASLTPQTHAQEQLWITQFGTSTVDIPTALAPDGVGGVFVAGYTYGSLGGPNLGGGSDAFLAHYDSAGNQLWIRQFGTSEPDSAHALAPDGAGGVMVAGWTAGDLGGGKLGQGDAFLAHYDSDGNQLWIKQFGTSRTDGANALAPYGNRGGVMVAGSTSGNLGGVNAGHYDVFLARYDGAGNQLWTRQFGTSYSDGPSALATDSAGNVTVAGSDGGMVHQGFSQAFLTRYDGAGNQLWIRHFGATGDDAAGSLASDGEGGVMVAGFTQGSLGGVFAGGLSDAFLARYDSAGDRLWIRQFGTSGGDSANGLTPDGAGGVIVAGWTQGSLGGPSAGFGDAFLARYDGAGKLRWIHQFGSNEQDTARAIAPDNAGGVIVAGYTRGNLGGPNAGNWDVFLARYTIDFCYADCDQSTGVGVLDMRDFLCFQESFVSGKSYACDCDTITGPLVCDIFDFLCFQNAFVNECP